MDEGVDATMTVGRHLLFHAWRNCTPPAIEEFPTGFFTLEERLQGAIVVHIIVAIYVLCMLAIISHEYFVPAIEKFVTVTSIDPDIVGTAVMATAASTPQLATALIGVFVAQSDIGVGAVVGSSYFNIFFIMGLSALVSKEPIRLNWWPVFRDVLFYILAGVILAVLVLKQKVQWWAGLILVLTYIIYIIVLVFNKFLEHAFTTFVKKIRQGFAQCRCKSCRDTFRKKNDQAEFDKSLQMSGNELAECNSEGQILNTKDVEYNSITKSYPLEDKTMLLADTTVSLDHFPAYEDSGFTADSTEDNCTCTDCFTGVLEGEYHTILRFPDVLWKRILWVILLPGLLIIYVIIPDCRRPSSWRYLFVFTILMSVLLIGFIAYVLVWMVVIIGSTIGIPDTVMGLTFLAAGSSVPDMMNAIFVARHGYGDMAVSNCIGSNIFDVLVCLGLPWFLDVLFARRTVPLIVQDDVTTISICLIASAFLVFCCLFVMNWRLNKVMGGMFIFAYLVFVIFTSVFSTFNGLPTCKTLV